MMASDEDTNLTAYKMFEQHHMNVELERDALRKYVEYLLGHLVRFIRGKDFIIAPRPEKCPEWRYPTDEEIIAFEKANQ